MMCPKCQGIGFKNLKFRPKVKNPKTFFNRFQRKICDMCGGDGMLSPFRYPLKFRIQECPRQTRLKIPFDGGENEEKWMRWGMPKGHIPDQYVETCKGEGRDLHIYKLGFYEHCNFCEEQARCQDTAACCAEQAEA